LDKYVTLVAINAVRSTQCVNHEYRHNLKITSKNYMLCYKKENVKAQYILSKYSFTRNINLIKIKKPLT